MKTLFILLNLVTVSLISQSKMPYYWVKQNCVPLNASFGMDSLIHGREIQLIGFGEASHGQGSFFKHKINSFKWLVENAGYKIFALEAGFCEAIKLNQYVMYGHGDAKEGLKYLNYGVWQIEDFVELIEWMRAYNKDKPLEDQVKFYGFDCQMAQGGVDYIKSIQSEMEYNFTLADVALFEDLLTLQLTRESKLAKSIIPKLTKFILVFKEKILASSKNDFFKNTALTVLTNLQYFCETESYSEAVNDLNRAKFMAANIDHILEIEGKATKMVLSAHNGHLSTDAKLKETGYWLKQKYGSKYYVVGYEFNYGNILGFDFMDEDLIFRDLAIKPSKPETLGFLFAKSVGQDCFLDISGKEIPRWFKINQWCSDMLGCYGQKGCMQRYSKINLAASYDGLMYIEKTEAAKRM